MFVHLPYTPASQPPAISKFRGTVCGLSQSCPPKGSATMLRPFRAVWQDLPMRDFCPGVLLGNSEVILGSLVDLRAGLSPQSGGIAEGSASSPSL